MFELVNKVQEPKKCFQIDDQGNRSEIMLDVTVCSLINEETNAGAQVMYVKEDGCMKIIDAIRYQTIGDQK